jgi:hypothetical protein
MTPDDEQEVLEWECDIALVTAALLVEGTEAGRRRARTLAERILTDRKNALKADSHARRQAYIDLCMEQYIERPCGEYDPAGPGAGIGADGEAVCAMCGHPKLVHAGEVANADRYTALLESGDAYLNYLEGREYHEDGLPDYENEIFETALEFLYGPTIWDRINAKKV